MWRLCVGPHSPPASGVRTTPPPAIHHSFLFSLISSHSVLNTHDSLQCSKKLQNKHNLLLLQFRSGIHLFKKQKKTCSSVNWRLCRSLAPLFSTSMWNALAHVSHIHGCILWVCPFSDLLLSIPHQGDLSNCLDLSVTYTDASQKRVCWTRRRGLQLTVLPLTQKEIQTP